MWSVTVKAYGGQVHEDVEAETIGEAVTLGLQEMGFDDAVDGSLHIEVSGEA